jgi:poly(hydroxyalkanoate) depolymerase family esterase
MHPLFRRLIQAAARGAGPGGFERAAAALRQALGSVVARGRRPADRVEAADEGCFLGGSHSEAEGSRAYKLYLPPGSRGSGRALVVMLHGCTQDPDDFAAGTAMNEKARQQGVCVLYPAQAREANAQGCWNWFQPGLGEPAILAGMIRQVMRDQAIDPRRVYVAGLSAGGAMATILGAAYPELFAAVGVHSGLAAGSARDLPAAFWAMKRGAPAAPRPGAQALPPTIVFHGDADATVSPLNALQVVAACAGAAVATAAPTGSSSGRTFTRSIYRDATGVERAELWLVHGGGHAWSGGNAAGSYTDPSGPDASAEMLHFFLARRRPTGF